MIGRLLAWLVHPSRRPRERVDQPPQPSSLADSARRLDTRHLAVCLREAAARLETGTATDPALDQARLDAIRQVLAEREHSHLKGVPTP